MIKAFFILYELALIAVGIWLCGQLRGALRKWQVIKKRYCLAPEYIRKGHTVEPTRQEIKPQLRAVQIELIGWSLIIFADIYACIGCFVWILK